MKLCTRLTERSFPLLSNLLPMAFKIADTERLFCSELFGQIRAMSLRDGQRYKMTRNMRLLVKLIVVHLRIGVKITLLKLIGL